MRGHMNVKLLGYFPRKMLDLLPEESPQTTTPVPPQTHPPLSGPICIPDEPLDCGRGPRSSGPLLFGQHSNPTLRYKVKCWPHNIIHHIKYGILLLKPHQYPLSFGVPVRERYGSTLLPATREQHNQNCTQNH